MSRKVQCAKLGRELDGLAAPPYPGDLGQRIYQGISQQAWKGWLDHQVMLINEYRLTPIEPKARQFLEQEMEKYLFGEGSASPPDYRAPTE